MVIDQRVQFERFVWSVFGLMLKAQPEVSRSRHSDRYTSVLFTLGSHGEKRFSFYPTRSQGVIAIRVDMKAAVTRMRRTGVQLDGPHLLALIDGLKDRLQRDRSDLTFEEIDELREKLDLR